VAPGFAWSVTVFTLNVPLVFSYFSGFFDDAGALLVTGK